MSETHLRKSSITSRLAGAFRSKKSSNKLRKESVVSSSSASSAPLAKPLQYGAIYRPTNNNTDEQTGENRDHTDLLHGLAHHSNSSLGSYHSHDINVNDRLRGEGDIAKLPPALWQLIASHYLSPSTAASLSFCSRTLFRKIGFEPFEALNEPGNEEQKLALLRTQDEALPAHLLCYTCAVYHLRLSPGSERLRTKSVPNPVVNCPFPGKPEETCPRSPISPTYNLPFTFVQLALRNHQISPNHGIPLSSLNKRWKASPLHSLPTASDWVVWNHQSRYYIVPKTQHLLSRISSWAFAAPELPASAQRHLLYDRESYDPYFSTCPHWRDGVLMDVAKCALSHIPPEPVSVAKQLKNAPRVDHNLARINRSNVTLCPFCRPMRRCTECPSEYLVEIKKVEDRDAKRFRWALSVTRWTDFGDAEEGPRKGEWAAVCGYGEAQGGERYDSFGKMGKRAISGIFESQSGVTMPGQRMMSLNPKKTKRDEEGDGWY